MSLIPPRHSRPSILGLWTLLLAAAPAMAGEITATGGAQGLGTAVNGLVGGSCGAGLCQVSGGTAAGNNLFHRFSAFDTRGDINGVNFSTGGLPNVFVGVVSPSGSFIDKPVSFSGPTNLFWLSPGGISVSGAGGFANIQQLNLSTATGWRVGNEVFDAAGTTAGQAALLTGTPLTGLAGAANNPATLASLGIQKNGDLSLSGGLLTVDQELLLDAQGGNVLLQAAQLAAQGSIGIHGDGVTLKQSLLDVSNAAAAAGDLMVQGRSIALDGTTLLANGQDGGGQIFVGGGLRDNSPAILKATTVRIDANSKLSANATSQGDGGKIVVHALDSASVAGQFTARGGALSTQGGVIETSAPRLDFSGLALVDTHVASGINGTWLIEPTNFSIVSGGTAENTITAALLQSNLALNNVLIETFSSGNQSGDITVAAPVTWNANRLTLSAQKNIYVKDDLVANETGSLSFYYGQGSLDGYGATYTVAPGAIVEVPLGISSFFWKKGTKDLPSPAVFDNGLLRFWQRADSNPANSADRYSFNGAGVLQQPAYLKDTTWYNLTFFNRPLEFALGIGGDGSANWNTNGTIFTSGSSTSYETSNFSSLGITKARMDVSRYLEGVGTVVTKLDLNPPSLPATALTLTNQYTLGTGAASVRVDAAITNRATAPLTNLRYWYGTGDDYVGQQDSPTKTRGNLSETGFVTLANALDPSNAIKIEANGQAVIFYSPSQGTATSINTFGDFSNAYNLNPAESLVSLTNDGSYAIYLRYPDVAPLGTVNSSYLYTTGATGAANSAVWNWATAVNLGSGDYSWSDPRNWLNNLVPFTDFSVTIGASPGFSGNIIYSTGEDVGQGLRLFSLNSAHNLSLARGDLTLGSQVFQASNFAEGTGITLGRGSLTVNGSLTVPSLVLNSGGLNGTGRINVTSGFLQAQGATPSSSNVAMGQQFDAFSITTGGPTTIRELYANGNIAVNSVGNLIVQGPIGSRNGNVDLTASGSNGSLQILDAASLTAHGRLISGQAGNQLTIDRNAVLDASTSIGNGGSITLDAPNILVEGTLSTSGFSTGGDIHIGSRSVPNRSLISNASLVADPPGLGGLISIDGTLIAINGSSLNVKGLSGGSISLGSSATRNLSLDGFTSLVGGGGAEFNLFANSVINNASIFGGKLINNCVVCFQPLPPVTTLPPISSFQQSVNPIQSSLNANTIDYSAPGSPMTFQSDRLNFDPLSISLTDSAFLYADSLLTSDTAVGAGGLSTQPVQQLSPELVSAQFNAAEQQAMKETAAKLGLDPGGSVAPTPAQLQASLRQVVEAVRRRRILAVPSSLPSTLPTAKP